MMEVKSKEMEMEIIKFKKELAKMDNFMSIFIPIASIVLCALAIGIAEIIKYLLFK
jgi:hypothetical protein